MNSTGAVAGSGAVPLASWLMCRIGDQLIAVPLDCVVETMRPLPLQGVSGVPEFVLGVSVIRGAVVPVIDVEGLLGTRSGRFERFVTIALDDRIVALAVNAVLGIRTLDESALHGVPPLLGALGHAALSTIGTLDSGLLLVLSHARLLSEEVWTTLDRAAVSLPVTTS